MKLTPPLKHRTTFWWAFSNNKCFKRSLRKKQWYILIFNKYAKYLDTTLLVLILE